MQYNKNMSKKIKSLSVANSVIKYCTVYTKYCKHYSKIYILNNKLSSHDHV